MYMKSTNHIPSPSSPPFTLFPKVRPHTIPILQSCLSLLVPKSMFKGVSQCVLCEYTSLWSIQPLSLLSFIPSPPPSIIQQLSTHIIISSTCTDGRHFHIVDYHSLFLPSFPECHRVVPWLQTCSACKIVYYDVCFYVCVYLLDLLSTVRENVQPLSFWTWLTSPNMMSSDCIHLSSKHMVSFFLMTE
jgi:hypothetical protein